MPRLASWNDGGNPDYRPKTYQDLADLPIILIVVEKGKQKRRSNLGRATLTTFLFAGKMGITYPKSLRFYDLRLRYVTTTQTTRSAMEQDFGRACRYVCDGDPPLPTVMSYSAKTPLPQY